LDLYGYPYVHEEFRFHMTLTNSLHIEDREPVLNCLQAMFDAQIENKAVPINRLCVFRQDDSESQFRIIYSVDFE
ncbi:MAG: DUF1045 domain-containing protein, partial [Alphaproteobacteria bacterium]|nr:DUF1045 domain-containing protein [Alphaproteobacteria bacterium]